MPGPSSLKVGIVGCGLVGNRRAQVAREAGDDVLLVADVNPDRARKTAAAVDADWTDRWQKVANHPEIDVVVVSTSNKSMLPVVGAALLNGKHTLCEKPLGRNAEEAREMVEAARTANKILKVGFNHRYHPAVWRAHELASSGAVGPLFSIRAAYGHGGRPGYDKEWRGNPDLAGGGELLDQGVHIVDLCRWFLGDFVQISGMIGTWFWQVDPLEDNGYALLRTASGQVATFHSSWTQWKNLFRFEVFGRDGFLVAEGLGGSYGPERLTLAERRPESGPPREQTWEYLDEDSAWRAEWRDFTSAIREQRQPLGTGQDGYQAARVIDAIYQSARLGCVVDLNESWR